MIHLVPAIRLAKNSGASLNKPFGPLSVPKGTVYDVLCLALFRVVVFRSYTQKHRHTVYQRGVASTLLVLLEKGFFPLF